MSWYAGLEKIVKRDVPLAEFTSFGIGGPAKYFVEPQTVEQVQEVIHRCRDNALALHVLGAGTNILVSDAGVGGVVLRLGAAQFGKVRRDGELLHAGSIAKLSTVVATAARAALAGAECLVGIPGSVGGGVKMNAGGSFGDVGSVIESITVVDASGHVLQRGRDDLMFGYRHTSLNAPVVLDATVRLIPGDPEQLVRRMKEIWMIKKNTQPMSARSAGCVFKNPRGMSAGALIDQAGLKGHNIGGAVVSRKHANYVTARKDATAADVRKLIDVIRARVKERFDCQLELELEIW
jgi:UDP-N-acetylmuramate dehydrogenase